MQRVVARTTRGTVFESWFMYWCRNLRKRKVPYAIAIFNFYLHKCEVDPLRPVRRVHDYLIFIDIRDKHQHLRAIIREFRKKNYHYAIKISNSRTSDIRKYSSFVHKKSPPSFPRLFANNNLFFRIRLCANNWRFFKIRNYSRLVSNREHSMIVHSPQLQHGSNLQVLIQHTFIELIDRFILS